MAKYIVAKIKGTIALAGGRAFFVPAGFTNRRPTWLDMQMSTLGFVILTG